MATDALPAARAANLLASARARGGGGFATPLPPPKSIDAHYTRRAMMLRAAIESIVSVPTSCRRLARAQHAIERHLASPGRRARIDVV